jgi:hypothetical protein
MARHEKENPPPTPPGPNRAAIQTVRGERKYSGESDYVRSHVQKCPTLQWSVPFVLRCAIPFTASFPEVSLTLPASAHFAWGGNWRGVHLLRHPKNAPLFESPATTLSLQRSHNTATRFHNHRSPSEFLNRRAFLGLLQTKTSEKRTCGALNW